jgi:hypothetical protein
MPLYPMRFSVTPEKNERIEAVVTLPEEPRSILHGTVYDAEGRRVKDAVVRLFACSEDKLAPAADTFTDADGEFVFGPLLSEKRYVVKVYVSGAVLREITVRPAKKRSMK